MLRKRLLLVASLISATILITLMPANSASISGTTCTKLSATKTVANLKYTCIKSGKKLIWNKGIKIQSAISPSPSPSVSPTPVSSPSPIPSPTPTKNVILPQAGTLCKVIGEKVFDQNGYVRCSWNGHANTLQEAENNKVWRYFSVTKLSSSKENNYKTIPTENAICNASGDTWDLADGILECRWTHSKVLKWIKINTVKSTFLNAKSPESIDVCKLQNSASTANQTGRNEGKIAGFPFGIDKNRKPEMYLEGTNEVLIVPVDFQDFVGGAGLQEQLAYDKKYLVGWYDYFSHGKSKFNVTTIDHWVRMPKNRAEYPTDGKTTNALNTGNQVMGVQAQVFIDEITKEVDLRKFTTVYMFFPNGEYALNDLIVRGHLFNIKEGQAHLNFFSWGRNLEGMETLKWAFYIHETLHDFNLIGHAPGNGWPLGIMTNQSGISLALNPYEQFLMGWLPVDQIYCDDARNLRTATVSLTPVEREDNQTKMAIIALSNKKAIVVESHGIDKWSNFKFGDREFPPGFYSIMAYVVDLDKVAAPPIKADGSSLSNDDWAWAVWQKVDGQTSNGFNLSVGEGKNLADYVAVLGDSFTIEGVKIEFIATGDHETIRISKV